MNDKVVFLNKAPDDPDQPLRGENRYESMLRLWDFWSKKTVINPTIKPNHFFFWAETPPREQTTPLDIEFLPDSVFTVNMGGTTIRLDTTMPSDDFATTGSSGANQIYVAGGPNWRNHHG